MKDGRRKTGTGTSRPVVDEALRRTLERDTAVQGEREEVTETTLRHPAGRGSALTTARPTGAARSRKAK